MPAERTVALSPLLLMAAATATKEAKAREEMVE
jgi:hypothetical protein